MTLFANDPPIQQWFKDLLGDLADAFPELNRIQLNESQARARLSKYWHAFHGVNQENVRKSFEKAAIAYDRFPSVPQIEKVMSEGFGSQPFTESKKYDHKKNKITRKDIDSLMKKAGLGGLK